MNLEQQIRILQAAQGDSARLALATVDIKYSDRPDADRDLLKEALEAAAVPHWCDEVILGELLATPVEATRERFHQLRDLRVIEAFPARGPEAINVHEATRLAIRRALASREPERLRSLSERAAGYFERRHAIADRIEALFHRTWLDPQQAAPEVREMEYSLRHSVEDSLVLATAFHEYANDDEAPPLVQAWGCWATSAVQAPYFTLARRLELAEKALGCAEAARSEYAIATVATQLAEVLIVRGGTGDTERAIELSERSLALRESLAKSAPDSLPAARDVSISLGILGDFLQGRRQEGDLDKTRDLYLRSLEIDERLLAATGSAQASRDVAVSLVRLAQMRSFDVTPGGSESALQLYERAVGISEALLAASPESTQAARDVAINVVVLADFLSMRSQAGDSDKVMRCYERTLSLFEDLYTADPKSAEAARDLWVNLLKLANFLVLRGQPGDAPAAFEHYRRGLEICERLLAMNPDSSQAARDFSIALSTLAKFLTARGEAGDVETAFRYREQGLQLSERILAASPNSADAARDVSHRLANLADMLTSRGLKEDGDRALRLYRRALEISERLYAASPQSANAARDFAGALMDLAAFLKTRNAPGDLDQAISHFRTSLEICERIVEFDADSMPAAASTAASLVGLGECLRSKGDRQTLIEALGYYRRAIELFERLRNMDSPLAAVERDASASVVGIADILIERNAPGDREEALGYYQRALAIDERLMQRDPHSAGAARDFLVSLGRMAQITWDGSSRESAANALEYQKQALEIALRLRASNPRSLLHARTAVIAYLFTSNLAVAAGDQELASTAQSRCKVLFGEMVEEGLNFDDELNDLHAQLLASDGPRHPPRRKSSKPRSKKG